MAKKIDLMIDKIFSIIGKFNNVINAILVTIMTCVVILDIFATLFKYPIAFTTELTGLTFAWITCFAGVSIAISDENIALTIIKDKFSGVARLIVDTLIDAICFVFCFVMFKSSIDMCISMHSLYMPLFRFPKSVLYASMLIMFGFISLVLILKIVQRLVKFKEAKP